MAEEEQNDLAEHEEQEPTTHEPEAPTITEAHTQSDLGGDLSDEPHDPPTVTNASLILGQLFVHYPSRDVTLVLDGDAAMRLLTMFKRRREGGLADVLGPDSSELSGWVVLDLDEPLAMTWIPGLPTTKQRTAVDPVSLPA